MQLELTERERQELAHLVKAAHADLGAEIHHADDRRYRETLRERRAVFEDLLKRFGADMKIAA